jgi:predicted kinase
MDVVMMCGLPATGKTTTAAVLHAHARSVLIRSCDVYQDLGVSLPDWVRRTQGFTRNVAEYDRLRDQAYDAMARRLERSLGRSPLVILDAVHAERAKRQAVYAICQAHGIDPVLLLCQCNDVQEVKRRFDTRRGREAEPEHEASDLSVFFDIARRWEDPGGDRLADGRAPTMVTFDTRAHQLEVRGAARAPAVALILAAVAKSASC